MKTTTKTVKTIKQRVELTGNDILKLMASTIKLPTGAVLKSATVKIEIPSGGDYSNMDLEIDSKTPVIAEYEIEEVC